MAPPPPDAAAPPVHEEGLLSQEPEALETEAGDDQSLADLERAAAEQGRGGTSSSTPQSRHPSQSRGQKRSRQDDDDVLRDIRDSMKANTQLLSQLVTTKPSSVREPFINFVADSLRSMSDGRYEEAKQKLVPLLLDLTKQAEADSSEDELPSAILPSTSRSSTSRSEMWQPPPKDWVKQPPPARMGVWGSASQEYMAEYQAAPYMPGYQQQQQFQPPQQRYQQQQYQPQQQQFGAPQQQYQQQQYQPPQQQHQHPQQHHQPSQQHFEAPQQKLEAPQAQLQQQGQKTQQDQTTTVSTPITTSTAKRESAEGMSTILGSAQAALDMSLNLSLPSLGDGSLPSTSITSLNTPPHPAPGEKLTSPTAQVVVTVPTTTQEGESAVVRHLKAESLKLQEEEPDKD